MVRKLKTHNKNKSNLKLWRYHCKKCNNQSNTIERCYEKPFDAKLCPKCGHTMIPKETVLTLNKKTKETITIRL